MKLSQILMLGLIASITNACADKALGPGTLTAVGIESDPIPGRVAITSDLDVRLSQEEGGPLKLRAEETFYLSGGRRATCRFDAVEVTTYEVEGVATLFPLCPEGVGDCPERRIFKVTNTWVPIGGNPLDDPCIDSVGGYYMFTFFGQGAYTGGLEGLHQSAQRLFEPYTNEATLPEDDENATTWIGFFLDEARAEQQGFDSILFDEDGNLPLDLCREGSEHPICLAEGGGSSQYIGQFVPVLEEEAGR